MIGSGVSQNAATERAAAEAADQASAGLKQAAWGLVVVGRRHDPETVLRVLRSHLHDIPLYGGAAVGAISHERLGYSGYEIGVLLFDQQLGMPRVQTSGVLDGREAEVGREFAEFLKAGEPSGNDAGDTQGKSAALLFYDVVRAKGGVHHGNRLLDGLYESLSREDVEIFGAGLNADFPVTVGYVFDGKEVLRGCAQVIEMPARIALEGRVMHGCTPVSSVMTVTRVDGARVLELDGVPAAARLREIAGSNDVAIAFSVLLGRRVGDPHAPFRETEFINRLIIEVDDDSGAIDFFEADIEVGDLVQVMFRNNEFLMQSIDSGVSQAIADLGERKPLLAMYIDCCGRASIFTGTEDEEADRLSSQLGEIPLFGFYVGREIAPYGGRSRPLDWTGVLMMLTDRG